MENKDLMNLLITDSEYYNSHALYNGLLRKKNIFTVEHLLTYYNNDPITFLKGYHVGTIHQIKALISTLEYKYLNKPLYIDALFDRKIDLKKMEGISKNLGENYNIPGIYLICTDEKQRRFINYDELFGYSDFNVWNEFKKTIVNSFQGNQDISKIDIKVIDFIKWTLQSGIKSLNKALPYSRTYVEAYQKNIQSTSETKENLEYLKGQLASLVETRESLNIKISNLEQRIKTLTAIEKRVK